MSYHESIELSIVIVNFNGKKFLPGCFDSIQHTVNCSFEIILVDNASSDGSEELIRTDYPGVRFIRCDQNLGFAGGNNVGVKAAQGRYILLLNNDTILLSDPALGCKILNDQPDIGALGARMLDADLKETASCGRFPVPHRLVFFSSMLFTPNKDESTLSAVDWIQGSFVMMRREDYLKVGGMAEEYFMYVEDVDLCKKISLKNLKIMFCSDLSYLHFGGYNPKRWVQIFRGLKRYHKKFSSFPIMVFAHIILYLGLISRLVLYRVLILFKPNSKEIRQFLDGVFRD